jgi:hypothetical protein
VVLQCETLTQYSSFIQQTSSRPFPLVERKLSRRNTCLEKRLAALAYPPSIRKCVIKIKVNFTLELVMKAQMGTRDIAHPCFNLGPRCVGWLTPRPDRLIPGMIRYPLCRRLGGLQGRSGRVQNISPPPGFNPKRRQYSWKASDSSVIEKEKNTAVLSTHVLRTPFHTSWLPVVKTDGLMFHDSTHCALVHGYRTVLLPASF